MFKQFLNLPTGHCVAWLQAVQVVSEPTCLALCCRGAVYLSTLRSYLPGTVLQGCRLFKWYGNLPARHCVAGVHDVKAESEPNCQALCCRGAECLNAVATYLPALCCRDAGC